MRLLLVVGEESAGLRMFRMIAGGSHELVAVMTSPPEDGGATGLSKAAENQGYPIWPAKLVKEAHFPERIRAERIDILLNVHSLVVLPGRVVEAPRCGCFNLHPGPLPRYAGLNSVSWAIYRGERQHGVTLHKMAPEIDTGPIVYQVLFGVGEDETAVSLFSRCVKEGLPLISRLLEVASLSPEKIPLIPQDLSRREYFGREIPNDGGIRWSASAEEIVNFVRACDYLPFRSPWGHPHTSLDGEEVSILKASRTGQRSDCAPGTVGEVVGSAVRVATSDEWVLVRNVLVAGRSLQPAQVLHLGSRLQNATTTRLPLA
jgi:methionyl-tRNA formyltransferase